MFIPATSEPTVSVQPKPKPACDTDIDVVIGRRIRLRRTLLGYSQERLGELIGVSYQQIQKYERAGNRVSASKLVQIARVLESDPADFLPRLGERSDEPDLDRAQLSVVQTLARIRTPYHLDAINRIAITLAEAGESA
ncbi:helix-turn-helix transcriptional regulator [Fodinicurvata sp. EGI_FJ10296]|uniref:helix-turn-helix domain-containing protein n=1 Tax=Fodinicurvata sp. EGI_FJ10296 TaxID=3231908 RepID=UPI003456C223